MKRLIIFCCMACGLSGANAQAEKGQWSLVPMVGTNMVVSKPLNALCGVTAGAAIDWQASNRIALSSGLIYSYQRYGFKDFIGISISQTNGAYGQLLGQETANNLPIRDGRLIIPLTVSAYVWKGLALKAGIQANVRLHSGIADYHEKTSTYGITIEKDISGTADAMHEFFFSLPVGISYEYHKFVLDVRYIFGLQNLSASWDVISTTYSMKIRYYGGTYYDDQKVNQLQLTLGYRLGL